MPRQYRQGDILIVEVSEITRKHKILETRIIVEGELTGHAHRLDGDAVLIEIEGVFDHYDNPTMFIHARGDDVSVTHDEHGSIKLPKGYYKVVRQREYNEREIFNVVRD